MLAAIKDFLKRPYLYIIIILIGTSFKFYQIDNRLFWEDEISTILHTSGIPLSQYANLIPKNEISSSKIYNDLLHLNTQDYTICQQIKGLFSDTHLTPFHYVPLMIWHRLVGDDAMDYRLFSIFTFIITLPVLFLLAKQLFQSELMAWITISLYSVSPTFHLFAQESRYYILWAFFIILSHYLFLKSLKHNQLKWWIVYTIIGILSLYTSVISGIVIFGHLVYLLVFKKKLWLHFGISVFIMLLFYSPWIYSMITNRNEIIQAMSWQINKDYSINPLILLILQIMGTTQIFAYIVDWSQYTGGPTGFVDPMMGVSFLLMILMLIFLVISLIYLFRKSSREVKYFLLIMILPSMIFYYTVDLIRNSWLSAMWRYQMISLSGILLMMANYLGDKIKNDKIIHLLLFVGFILTGLFSINVLSHNRCWMTRNDCTEDLSDAQLLTRSSHTLVITDFVKHFNNFMVVLNECNSDNIDVLYASPDINSVEEKLIGKEYSDIFVFHASNELIHNLRNQFGSKMDSLETSHIAPIWRVSLYD
jgi:uncharacterized membrane protein